MRSAGKLGWLLACAACLLIGWRLGRRPECPQAEASERRTVRRSQQRQLSIAGQRLAASIDDMRRISASVKEELASLERDRGSLLRTIRSGHSQIAGLQRRHRQLVAEAEQMRLAIDSLRASQDEIELRRLPALRLPPNVSVAYAPLAAPAPNASCTFDTCVNFGNCGIGSGRVFGFVGNDSRLLRAARRLVPQLQNYASACVVLTDSPQPLAVGLNVVFLGDGRPASGGAMRAAATFGEEYRRGFDIVLPAPAQHATDSQLWASSPPLVPARRRHLLAALRPQQFADALDQLVAKELRRLLAGGNASGDSFLLSAGGQSRSQLAEATFCLLLPPGGRLATSAAAQRRLLDCLLAGSVPLILGDLLLPFAELIPNWRLATVRLPRARFAAEGHFLLRTFSDASLLELRRQGRLVVERFVGTEAAQARALLALLLRRLRLPGPAPPRSRAPSAFASGRQPPTAKVPSHFEEYGDYLGPVDAPLDSTLFQLNFTQPEGSVDPFFNFPAYAEAPAPPTEAQHRGSSYRWRPIRHADGTAGQEFSRSLGGNLPGEQFTIVVLTHDREAVLLGTLSKLRALPYLHSVLVVWNGRQPPSAGAVWPDIGAPIRVLRAAGNSLNSRFLPWDAIRTEAVFTLDDDVYMRQDEIVLAFRVWRENRHRIVGFPARFHAWTGDRWAYNSNQTCEFSMVLTGAAFLHVQYLYLYSHWLPAALRAEVDRLMNCEDILMNFLVSHLTRRPPIKVTSRWTFTCFACTQSLYRDELHYSERSHCLNYFSKMFGYNPLLYSQSRADSVLFKTRVSAGKSKCFKWV